MPKSPINVTIKLRQSTPWKPPSNSALLQIKLFVRIFALCLLIGFIGAAIVYWRIPPGKVKATTLPKLNIGSTQFNTLLASKLKLIDEYLVDVQGPFDPDATCHEGSIECSPMGFMLNDLGGEDRTKFKQGVEALRDCKSSQSALRCRVGMMTFRSLYEAHPTNRAIAFNYAYVLFLNRNPDQAIRVMEPVLDWPKAESDPKRLPYFILARFNQAMYYLTIPNYGMAKTHFRFSIRYFRRLAETSQFGPLVKGPYDYCRLMVGGVDFISLYPVNNLAKTYLLMKRMTQPLEAAGPVRRLNKADNMFQIIKKGFNDKSRQRYRLRALWAADNYRAVYQTIDYRQEPILTFNLGILAVKLGLLEDAAFFFEKARNSLGQRNFAGLMDRVDDNLALVYLRMGDESKADQLIDEISRRSKGSDSKHGISLSQVTQDLKQVRNLSELNWQPVEVHFKKRLEQKINKELKDFITELKTELFQQGLNALGDQMSAMAKDGDIAGFTRLNRHIMKQDLSEALKRKIIQKIDNSWEDLSLISRLRLALSFKTFQTYAWIILSVGFGAAIVYLWWFMAMHLKYRRILLDSDFINRCASSDMGEAIDLKELTRYARREGSA